VKQGCIVLGDTQSGKTALVNILETALNKAMKNELKLRVAQAHKDRMREMSIKYIEEKRQEEENPKSK
jgi:nicotinamide riboside kinase